MDNANDLSDVSAPGPPVAPAPAASDATALPLAANAPPVKVGDYIWIMYEVLTKGDGTRVECPEHRMPAKVTSVDPEKKTFVAEGVFAAGAFGSTAVETDDFSFEDPDWSPLSEVAGMQEGERIAFSYGELKDFFVETVYEHDTPPSCAFLKLEDTSRGTLVIQVSRWGQGARPRRIILNGVDLPIATPFDANQFVAESFGGDVGAAPSAGLMAEMEIELSELESELVHHGRIEILGKRRAIWENGTDFKVLMRGPPSRVEPVIGWARDIDLAWCAGASEEEMDMAKTLDPELGPRLNETEATVGTAVVIEYPDKEAHSGDRAGTYTVAFRGASSRW